MTNSGVVLRKTTVTFPFQEKGTLPSGDIPVTPKKPQKSVTLGVLFSFWRDHLDQMAQLRAQIDDRINIVFQCAIAAPQLQNSVDICHTVLWIIYCVIVSLQLVMYYASMSNLTI